MQPESATVQAPNIQNSVFLTPTGRLFIIALAFADTDLEGSQSPAGGMAKLLTLGMVSGGCFPMQITSRSRRNESEVST